MFLLFIIGINFFVSLKPWWYSSTSCKMLIVKTPIDLIYKEGFTYFDLVHKTTKIEKLVESLYSTSIEKLLAYFAFSSICN